MTLAGNGQMTVDEAYDYVQNVIWDAIHISKQPPGIKYRRWNKSKRTIEFSHDGRSWFRITVEGVK